MSEFHGFSADAFQFFSDIKENNNKEWFTANKPRFQQVIQKTAQEFVVALGERLRPLNEQLQFNTKLTGSGSIMRIYRDVRFSKDKSPYKSNLGMVWWLGAGKKTECPAFYFHMDADSCWFGGGLYGFPKPFMDSWRRMVDDELMGARIEDALGRVQQAGYTLNGDRYKRVPRGYDADHPRGELLKFKGLTTGSGEIPREVVNSAELVDHCYKVAEEIYPLIRVLHEINGM